MIAVVFGNLFKRKSPEQRTLEALIAKVQHFYRDESFQNSRMPESFQAVLNSAAAVDELPRGEGELGRDPRNPIPVNGPFGEVVYLSSLASMSGSPVIGHRLGSIGNYDAFETVTLDGERWDILYFDMYHPRKSRRAPSGYALREPGPFAYATNLQVSDFPRQAREAIADWTRDNLGLALVGRDIAPALQSVAFQRPAAHAARLSTFVPDGSTRRPPDPRLQLWIAYCEEQTKLLIALLDRRIGIKDIDTEEIFFFVAATLLYAHSKYGVSSANTNFVEQFQTSIVADCLKRTTDFGVVREQFHLRVREYGTLYDSCFDQANTDQDKGPWLVTIMMHLVERAAHAPAKGFMISIASSAVALAAVVDDAFQLVRKPLSGG